ncbi:MAG: RdgB/HAM1 family non-canonical purine NTP pyrophosphatase [Clostridia bacterium]|nr:RdgB/HAM1 family non-canonical purine NTP pyrophosphatase [Clostridia bacterium]
MKAVLSSRNKKKLLELQRILSERIPTIELYLLDDVGISGDAEETGETFEENALIKARFGAIPGYYAFADDSGLEVDALDGRPGVYSARYAGEPCNDENNNDLLLSEMRDVPREKRTGRYVSVIACVTPDGREFLARGTCEGEILFERRGQGGFGYDPLFYVPVLDKTFAEVTAEEKDAVSHRGNALRLFLDRYADKIVEVDNVNK